MAEESEEIPNVPMYEVMDAILIHLNKNRGWYMDIEDLHLATSTQVGDFFLNFRAILKELLEAKMIKERRMAISAEKYLYSYEIEPKGTIHLDKGGYSGQAKEKAEIDKLTKDKLMIDVTNAENVYKTYPLTKALAIGGFVIAVILAILKLIEALR